jgi:hypothetical protein
MQGCSRTAVVCWEDPLMSTRLRMIGPRILLVLALASVAFWALQTANAVADLQQHIQLIEDKDVRGIRPWMTLHYAASIYDAPETCLVEHLGFAGHQPAQGASLRTLADSAPRPIDEVVGEVQRAILLCRHEQDPPRTLTGIRQLSGVPRISSE